MGAGRLKRFDIILSAVDRAGVERMTAPIRYGVLLILGLVLIACPVLAQEQTFRKEVKQIMGSSDSPDSARTAAITKAKRDALEEAGTWLESQSEIRNFNLARDDVTALASGITKTRVIEEHPFVENGVFGLRVVVEVRVDNSGLADRVRQFLAERKRLAEEKENWTPPGLLPTPNVNDLVPVTDCILPGEGNPKQFSALHWYELGQALWDTKRKKYSDIATTAKFFSNALAVDSNLQKALLARGKLCRQDGNYEAAVQALDQAIKLDSKDSDAYSMRGSAYDSLKKHDLAIVDHNQAILLNPNRVEYYDLRGISYMQLRQFKLAQADFYKGVQLEPTNGEAYRWRSVGFAFTNKNEKALADMNRAIQLDPENSGFYVARSQQYKRMDNFDLALSDINRALELAHHDDGPAIVFWRATIYMSLNRMDKALEDFLLACGGGSKAACDMAQSIK